MKASDCQQSTNGGSEWTQRQTTELIRGFAAGESASTVGRKIGKSRNAVLSKGKRLGVLGLSIRKPFQDSREGQSSFRAHVLELYGSRCCVSGATQTEAIEAAHIVPYSVSKDHSPSNGLCLRSDIHALFDCEKLLIFPDFSVRFASDVEDETYVQLAGTLINVPTAADRCRVSKNLSTRLSLQAMTG